MGDIDDMVAELLTHIELPTEPQEMFEMRSQELTRIIDPELKAVVDEISLIAFSNIADLLESHTIFDAVGLDEDNNAVYQPRTFMAYKDFTSLPRSVTAAVSSVKIDGDKVEIKMYDKQAAQDKLMKFHGGYAKDNKQVNAPQDRLLDMLFSSAEETGLPTPTNNDA